MSEQRSLEATLTAMAGAIAFPREPDLAPAVRERIAGDLARKGAAVRQRVRRPLVTPARLPHGTVRLSHRTVLRLAVAALALGVFATGVLFFSPTARRAVAGWLGLPGIHISTTPGGRTPAPGGSLDLGPRVTLAEAAVRLGSPVKLPSGLGAPDAIHADGSNPIVWLVYPPTAGLPAVAGHDDVGLLVTEIRSAGLYGDFYKKLVGSGAEVRNVSVGGVPGFWIHGQPHIIEYQFPLGFRLEDGRISGNSLIWAENGITYRLELAGGLHAAQAIAASLH